MNPPTTRKSWISARLQIASYIFLFFGCAAFAGVGATVAFIDPTRSRAMGISALIIAGSVGTSTVRLWKRVLPAIFACGALNGLIIIGQGHALNSPDVVVARSLGVVLTLAMISAAALTARANSRRFTSVERLSFIGIFLCFIVLFSSFDIKSAAVAGAVCCACIPPIWDLVTRRSKTLSI